MKHISKKRASAEILEKAMKQLRETRAALEKDHPELLKTMRKLVAKQGIAKGIASEKPIKPQGVDDSEEVAIDRKKNLETILRYTALKPGSDGLKKELKDFLN